MELPRWLCGKEPACQCERCRFAPWVWKIPWSRKWQPTPVFCLENPMGRGAWWTTVHGVAKSQSQLSMSPSLLIEILLERNPLNKNKSHKKCDICQRTSLSYDCPFLSSVSSHPSSYRDSLWSGPHLFSGFLPPPRCPADRHLA